MHASMRTQRGLTYTVALTAALGLAFAGWTHITPASAQDDANKTGAAPAGAGGPALPQDGGRMMRGPASLAASGDYVYVLRGNTLTQLKASDLSVVTQKDLPAAGGPAAGGAAQ